MKTYEQGKAELDAELKRLNDAIKFAKKNTTYDFKCPQCKKVKEILVIRMKQGRLGLKYCSSNCRGAAHRDKHKKKFIDEITRLKNRIKELENENL